MPDFCPFLYFGQGQVRACTLTKAWDIISGWKDRTLKGLKTQRTFFSSLSSTVKVNLLLFKYTHTYRERE